jgi:hypothetical protein
MRPLRPRVDALEKQMSLGAGDLFAVLLGGQVFYLSAADMKEIIREAGGSSRGLPDPREREMVAELEAESGPP